MALKFMADKAHAASPEHGPILTSAREICDEFKTPFDTTAKVMQLMNNQDILKSVKGIKGGYSLNKNLNEITYMELVRLIEGREHLGRVCEGKQGTCELFGKCNIATPVEKLNRKLNLFLETLTLEDLLQGAEFNHARVVDIEHAHENTTQENTL